jgi:hypothetical protein
MISLGIAIVAATGAAQARSYRVSPQPCPVPADVPSIVPERDSATLGADDRALGYGFVVLDVPLTSLPNGEIFKRFLIDMRTGAIDSEPSGSPRVCE